MTTDAHEQWVPEVFTPTGDPRAEDTLALTPEEARRLIGIYAEGKRDLIRRGVEATQPAWKEEGPCSDILDDYFDAAHRDASAARLRAGELIARLPIGAYPRELVDSEHISVSRRSSSLESAAYAASWDLGRYLSGPMLYGAAEQLAQACVRIFLGIPFMVRGGGSVAAPGTPTFMVHDDGNEGYAIPIDDWQLGLAAPPGEVPPLEQEGLPELLDSADIDRIREALGYRLHSQLVVWYVARLERLVSEGSGSGGPLSWSSEEGLVTCDPRTSEGQAAGVMEICHGIIAAFHRDQEHLATAFGEEVALWLAAQERTVGEGLIRAGRPSNDYDIPTGTYGICRPGYCEVMRSEGHPLPGATPEQREEEAQKRDNARIDRDNAEAEHLYELSRRLEYEPLDLSDLEYEDEDEA